MASPHSLQPQAENSNQKNKNYAIIVAAGSGSRMNSAVPKQFLPLNGRPVLMYTINAFYQSDSHPQIIVVLPVDYHAYWEDLRAEHDFHIPHKIVKGGETRFQSVKNGLNAITEDSNAVVAIHDAVRPLIAKHTIDESYAHAAKHGNAITALKSRDSVRQKNGHGSVHLNREEIYLIQTPQTFQVGLLKKAYAEPYQSKFTDDASVVEQAGSHINLIEGSYQNIKITFPEDIAIAESLILHNR